MFALCDIVLLWFVSGVSWRGVVLFKVINFECGSMFGFRIAR
jgi:hypothetical protein